MTDVPDESTIRIRRGPAADPDPDGATELSARRTASEETTEPSDPGTAEPSGPRRRSAVPDTDADADEGSTIVARRESRRRASRAVDSAAASIAEADAATVVVASSGASRGLATTLAGNVPAPLGRVAQVPAQTGTGYAPRAAEPVMATRAVPTPRAPQAPVDSVAVEHAARRRARRRAAVVVALSVVVALVAAAAILILVIL